MPKWCAEGLTSVGDIYLKGISLPSFYLGLYKNTAEPAADAEMTAITEAATPGDDGYTRIALAPGDWAESPTGVWTNITKSFTASGGDWGSIRGFFITTDATGTAGDLVCVKHFPQGPYQVSDGNTLLFTPVVTDITAYFPFTAYIGSLNVVLLPNAGYSIGQPGDYDWLLVDYANRLYDWQTYCGIPGGIPNRTTIYTSLGVPGQAPTYAQSVAATQINAAVAACPENQVVYLYPGTYTVGQMTYGRKHGVTLRGAGAGKTILQATGSRTFINSYTTMSEASGTALSSGYARGSTVITLASAPSAYFYPGNLVVISEDRSPNKWGTGIGTYNRPGATTGGVWNLGANRLYYYTSRIVSVNGNDITLASPIPVSYDAALNPRAYPIQSTLGVTSLCGIEDLTIAGSNTYECNVYWYEVDRCWTKGVEIRNLSGADIGHIEVNIGFQCEIRKCYIHDVAGYPNQADGVGTAYSFGTCNSIIEDSIFTRVQNIVQNNGASCNVYLHNYALELCRAGQFGTGVDFNHGPHGLMNLAEGNIMPMTVNDGYHGSSSHNTIFRNNANGLNSTQTVQQKMVNLARGSYFHLVIGNVLGDASWNAHYYDVPYPGGSWPWTCMYSLGWPTADGGIDGFITVPWENWTKPTNQLDADVIGTLIRHGNYDYFNNAVVWNGGIASHSIPNSLFYSSKPAFFGSLAWPAIGPDLGTMVGNIPAKARWDTYAVSGNLDDLFA